MPSPPLQKKPLASLRREHILCILDPLWSSKHETATKLRQKIRSILQWGLSRGYCKENVAGEQINGALPSLSNVKQHHPSLPFADIPKALHVIRDCEVSLESRLCLEFLILTATRSGEARGCSWDEINFDESVWTIPGFRMKGKRELRVPLSAAAIDVLQRARKANSISRLVFPSPHKSRVDAMMNVGTLNKILVKTGLEKQTVVHGFRSSFRTWAAEQTEVPGAVIELSLAHTIGNQVEQSYNRSDLLLKRRGLMELWSNFVTGQTPEIQAKVIPLKTA